MESSRGNSPIIEFTLAASTTSRTSHEFILSSVNFQADIAIHHQIRIFSDFAQIKDNSRPAPAHFGGDPIHAQSLDPPFSRQLGEIDSLSPGDRVKRITAQGAWFE